MTPADPKTSVPYNTIQSIVGMTIPLLVGLVSIPFAIKGLGELRFGIFTISWAIMNYVAIMDMGISKAIAKFVAEYNNGMHSEDEAADIWVSFLIAVVIGVVAGILLFGASDVIAFSILNIDKEFQSEASQSLHIVAFSLLPVLLSSNARGILQAKRRFRLLNWVIIPVNTLSFVIPALTYFNSWTVPEVIAGIMVVRIVGLMALLFHVQHISSFNVFAPRYSARATRKLLGYGKWVALTGVISPLIVYIDKFVIGAISGMQALTFYAAPFEAVNKIRIIPISIAKAIFPEFSQSHSEGNDKHLDLFVSATKITAIVMVLFILPVLIFHQFILDLWLGNDFVINASRVFAIFWLGIVFNSIAFIPFTYLQGIGRPNLPAKLHFMELILYVFLLIPMTMIYGITGAAIAWLIRVSVDFIAQFALVALNNRGSKSRLFGRELLVALSLTGVVILCFPLVLLELSFAYLILLLMLFSGLVLYLAFGHVLTFREQQFLRKRFRVST